MSSDPEVTQTFTPSGEDADLAGRKVELFDPNSIEERIVGEARPASFDEHYLFAGRVGSGGMGVVELAHDRVLARDVAIKLLRKKLRTDKRVVRRFLREAQVTAQLEHPNVVPFHALESTGDGSPAFVMKLVEGETFKEYTRRCEIAWGTPAWSHTEFGVKARVELFLKVCDAIAYSHSRGVIHRDIKPSNIMRGDFNVVYVMDWGIARLVGRGDDDEDVGVHSDDVVELPETRTMTGDLVGTPLYMSPEQALKRSDELTPASDQYSLGLLLFNLVTCEAPRAGRDVFEVIERAAGGLLEPYPTQGPGREAPKELRAIIARATRPNPDLRYPSVAELAADLRRFLHGEEVRAHPDNLVRAVWRKITQHPTVTLTAILGLVLVAGTSTTWSLVEQLRQREVAERRTALLTDMLSDVTFHVQQLDVSLSQTEVLLTRMTVDLERRLEWRPPSDSRWLAAGDLLGSKAPPDTRALARYGQLVSFSAPLRVLTLDADRDENERLERRLGDLTELLRAPFVRRSGDAGGAGRPVAEEVEAQELSERQKGDALQYTYVGFETGLYFSFPAVDFDAVGYDHRTRPWYVLGRDGAGPSWGSPYLDASGSGYLMPCASALRGVDGEFLGVVGASVTLDGVIKSLEVPSVPEARVVRLVDSGGEVLIDSREWGSNSAGGSREGGLEESLPLGIPEVERELALGDPAGVVLTEDALYAWSRFSSIDWVLLVELPASYLPD